MIGAVVLAAGASTRMGTQKLLLPVDGQPLVRLIVSQLSKAPIDSIVVVTGHDQLDIEDALVGLSVTFAHNANWREGMLSSVRTGVRSLPEKSDVLVALGDQPVVPPDVVSEMVSRLGETDCGIVVPLVGDRRGHPIAIHRAHRGAILERYEDVGLRGLLREHRDCVVELPASEAGLLVDLDSPEDYERAINEAT